ncbi:MAG: GSCFA domain-containing protein [Ferruginibacter sp.]
MDFHAEFTPKEFDKKIEHHHNLLLIGSCFTEQIGKKLADHKFEILQNPNGILFNPVSICYALDSYMNADDHSLEDLFYQNELWSSWKYHSRFSGMDAQVVLNNINRSRAVATEFLKKADWLFITLGSAYVYENKNNGDDGGNLNVVANCHKVAPDKFNRRLLKVDEVTRLLENSIRKLKIFNPTLKIIFTISPVRHLREGFIENNRSKATLIHAVHEVTSKDSVFYFPAYELVIDDLRDYRFYAEDLVHPNYSATNYVWEKFLITCIDGRSREIMKEIAVINAAVNHRPFNPASQQHKKFKEIHLKKISMLIQKHHYLHFDKEISFLSSDQESSQL